MQEKLISSRDTLSRLAPASPAKDAAMERLTADIARLGKRWIGAKVALMGIEGKCAQLYFDAWRDLPIA